MQTLRIDFQEGDLPTLHPHDLMVYLRGITISKNLFEGLTRIDAQGKAQLTGAKSVEISPDRLRYTFTLRDNSWSDGTPVTAFHYENAWKEVLSPTSTCPRAELLYMIKNGLAAKKGEIPIDAVGVKAKDAKTLIVDLAYPSPFFLELVATPLTYPLLHPKQKEQKEFNGAFMISKWEKGSLLQLKPNPHFWNHKEVSLQQIDVYMIQDTNTAYSYFKEGKIDWIGVPLCNLTAEQIERLKEAKNLQGHAFDRAFWVFFNTQHPAISSPLIRQALSMAIHRQAIVNHILIGGNPLLKPIPSALLPVAVPIVLREDLVEARKRFDQGLKELGYTKETLPPLIISYAQQANRKQMAEYLQEAWTNAFGIKVQLEVKDWNTLRSNLSSGQFDICGVYEAAFYKDPLEMLERFTTINSANFAQWTNPQYGRIVDAARQEKDFQRRTQLLGEAEQLLIEQMPFIPICSDKLLFSTHPDLEGYVFDYVGAVDFSYASFKK